MAIDVAHHIKPLELARLKHLVKYKMETFKRVYRFFDHQLDPQGEPALDDAIKRLAEDSFKSFRENMRMADRNEAIGDLDDASSNMRSAYQVLDYVVDFVRQYANGFYRRRDLPAKYRVYSSRY